MEYAHSGDVRTVLKQANIEAEALRHEYIGTEHILLGLLQQETGPAVDVLAALDVDTESLRAWILKKVKPGRAGNPMEARPYTSRAKHVLEYAMDSARYVAQQFGVETRGGKSATVETDHLLLGLIREEKGIAAQALQAFGVTWERAGQAALHRQGQTKPPPAPDSTAPVAAEDTVWYVEIDFDSNTPIYEQLIARIEEAVATNFLVSGERLPPVRDLAAELGIAPGTVARAYSALEQRGVLETEGARGTRVAARPTESARDDGLQPALADLLRPIAVAAYHMGAGAEDVHAALESAMLDIFRARSD